MGRTRTLCRLVSLSWINNLNNLEGLINKHPLVSHLGLTHVIDVAILFFARTCPFFSLNILASER